MVPFLLSVARRISVLLGVFAVWFAVERWLWFHTLPRHASPRFCGNCFLAAVGVPTELGLLGLFVIGVSFLKVRFCLEHVSYCCFAAVGVFLTPAIIGVPVFAFGFLSLVLTMKSGRLRGPVSQS